MRPIVRNLIGLGGFFLIWEVAARSGLVSTLSIPPASEVLPRLVDLLSTEVFLRDVIATVLAWAIGLGIAIAIAVPAGLVLGSLPAVRVATRAIVEFLRPIPSVALIPAALVLIGGGPDTKITLAVYASVWPIMFNTIYALDEIDPLLVDTARSFGTSRARVMTSVALPHAAPFIFTGIRLSAAIALIVVISVEYVAGAIRGIGRYTLEVYEGAGRMDLVLAATIVAGVIGYLINEGLERLGRRWFRWSTVVGETK
ncbi:MAG TPA: ABC transporter permease [Actinophytocola sp.]|uniref:ABC transporter permease n=1 Tax=Actinophytocola sp. TaxID=1872138 RepID=UPI002DDCF49B|nr:ABC transporter permease [Actinophytocola sp.]HEV2784479.1 ABC transporter permease [Actinophytocola sp.]